LEKHSHIIITGASGFIGSYLVNYFSSLNFKVTALLKKTPTNPLPNVTYVVYNMAEPVDANIFTPNAILIHCAYSKKAGSTVEDINETATIHLLKMARANGVKHCVFFSSISATSTSGTYYAKQKNTLEKLFNTTQDIILRPGLVIGNGGLFANTVKFITRFKVLPMVGNGKQPVYYIAINDVAKALYELLNQQRCGTFYICNTKPMPYKTFYKTVASVLNTNIITLPLPLWFLKIALTIYGLLPKASINADNLKGLNEVPLLDEEIKKQSVFSFQFKTVNESLSVSKIN
jgi:nucleoside-diphosphate-sugar epimerase